MKKNFVLLLITILLLILPAIWYNLNREAGFEVKGVEEPLSEQEKREPSGEEILFCSTEIPIGEVIEGSWHFACQSSITLRGIQLASLQYRQTIKEIAELAIQCSANSCLPNCVSQTRTNDNGTPNDSSDDFEEQICTPQACFGDPCPRQEIENKYAKLVKISQILADKKESVNRLFNTERPGIKNKLDETRQLLEFNAPLPEQYHFSWFTPCETAITEGWIELEDFQNDKVCKSFYNYLICR